VPASATWLVAEVTGVAPNYTITLRPNTTQRSLGTSNATVTVTTNNSAGAALVSHDIQVSYELYQGIAVTRPGTLPFVFGGPETSTAVFTVNSNGRNYTVQTLVPWLTVPSGQQSGLSLPIGVDVATLAPGSYGGIVFFTAVDDPLDTVETSVELFISPPMLSTSTSAMVLGGDDGLGSSLSGSLDLSLNTAPNSWPWTVEVQGFSVPAALTTPVNSGTVGGASTPTFSLNADRSQLRPGTYTATLHFTTTIKGMPYTRDVPLTLNWESQRLVPRFDGLAFTSTPSRAPVARQVVINDSRGRTGIPWSAVADAQWLHVSPASGVTGDTLTVTVTPGGLLTDALYNGTIVLTSTSPSVERPEAIRVALWKSSTNPVKVSRLLPDLSASVVTNPVEPWAYTVSRYIPAQPGPGGTDGQVGGIIRVYHVFTGDLLNTFQSGTAHPGSMTISSDGTRLFVTDYATPRTIELDALNGAQLASYPASQMEYAQYDEGRGIAFLRMNGRPVVWPAFTPASGGTAVLPIDVETGQGLHLFSSGPGPVGEYSPRYDTVQTPSPDGQFMYTSNVSPYAVLAPTQHYFSVLGGGPRIRAVAGQFYGHGDGVQDVCVTADNRVWQSTGYMPMPAYDSHLENVVASVAMPTNILTWGIVCGTYGRNYVIISEYNGNGAEDNIAMFTDSGALLGTYRHGPPSTLISTYGMRLSGDGSRIVWPMYGIVNNRAVDDLEIATPP